MPKFLFSSEFNSLNNDGRVLYSIMRERFALSLKNGWFDDEGNTYLYYKRSEMQQYLGASEGAVKRAMDALKKHGLVEEKKQGLGRPNRIYLLMPVDEDNSAKTLAPLGNI